MNKDKFDEEVRRGLDNVEKRTTYTDWVNASDKKKSHSLVDPKKYQAEVPESVDGLPVKDKDLVDDDVELIAPTVGESPRRTVSETDGTVSNTDNTASSKMTVAETVEWVDGDKDRAQQALDEENEKSSPRKSLVEKLEEIIGE